MNAYTHLQQHNHNHKNLVCEAQKVRTANAAQTRQTSVKKNLLIQLLTFVTRG